MDQVRTLLKDTNLAILESSAELTVEDDKRLETIETRLEELVRVTAGRHLLECPTCHRAIGDGKFCAYCGAKTDPNLRKCPACHWHYPPGFVYCPRCGKTLEHTHHWVFDFTDLEDFFMGMPVGDDSGDEGEEEDEDNSEDE
ncbi:MAG: hypothetical protein RBG13Loki_0337 [Promethearchaeota archaeon CR_4]|nr:MAG: hypothetical protein RBG13Loki_0337 [Candidatus Lokiarchaeota archaeon CR_4]